MKLSGRSLTYLIGATAVLLTSQMAMAQTVNTCTATNALVVGPYGFMLTAGTFIPVLTTPPGTTVSTVFAPLAVNPPGTSPYSNTQLGRLLSGVAGNTAGSSPGVFYFDGSGNIFASAIAGGSFTQLAGTYSVDVNCGVAITLNDVFGKINRQTTFAGELDSSGTNITVVATSQIPTNIVGPTTPPSAVVQFLRMAPNPTCSAASLTGRYLLFGYGFQAGATLQPGGPPLPTPTTPATPQPFTFLARMVFDGNGNIVAETNSTLGLSLVQYTGTYTINADCTGTMTVSKPPIVGTAPTTPGSQTTIAFLLTNPIVQVDSNGVVAFQNTSQLRSSIVFSFATLDQIVSGIGRSQ